GQREALSPASGSSPRWWGWRSPCPCVLPCCRPSTRLSGPPVCTSWTPSGISERSRMTLWSLLTALLLLASLPKAGIALTAEEIVRQADEVRSPAQQGQDFIWTVTITATQGEKAPDVRVYDVFVKGFGKVFVQFTAPPREVGRSLLALDRDLWIYLPS